MGQGQELGLIAPQESQSYLLVSFTIFNNSPYSERLDSDGFKLVAKGLRVAVDTAATDKVSRELGVRNMGSFLGVWLGPSESERYILAFQPSKSADNFKLEISRSDQEHYEIDLAPYLAEALSVEDLVPTPTPSPMPTLTPIPTSTAVPMATAYPTLTPPPAPTALPSPTRTSNGEGNGDRGGGWNIRYQIIGRDASIDPDYVVVAIRFQNETGSSSSPPDSNMQLTIGSSSFPVGGIVDEYGDYQTGLGFALNRPSFDPGQAATLHYLFRVPPAYPLDDAVLTERR